MTKLLLVIPLLLSSSFLLADEPKPDAPKSEPPAEKSTWKIEATPDATDVKPGQAVKIKVRIVNDSEQAQTAFIRNLAWFAHSDNQGVSFPSWPKMAGHGPVVQWQGHEVASQEAYSHDWTCTVGGSVKAGELTFRIGVPVASGNSAATEKTLWSEPIKLTVK